MTPYRAMCARPHECGQVSPDGRSMCDRPIGHDGDHYGHLLPTVDLDERADQ